MGAISSSDEVDPVVLEALLETPLLLVEEAEDDEETPVDELNATLRPGWYISWP